MERKERRRADLEGTEYKPVTERGEIVQAAQDQSSIVEDARERFDAARTAYSEARELGFSRTRSVYEAAREALLFGVEDSAQEIEVSATPCPQIASLFEGLARMQARQQERQREREREEQRALIRPPSLEESIWASLDKIGLEQSSSPDRDGTSDAMDRIQQRTTEQQQEREREAAKVEQERLEREELEQERDQNLGLGYGM